MTRTNQITSFASVLALIALAACTPPALKPPASMSDEVRARAGVDPAWQTSPAPTAESLREASAQPLPSPLDESAAVAIALGASPEIGRLLTEAEALRAEALDSATPINPAINFTSAIPLGSMGVVPIFAMVMAQVDELWKQPIRSEAARDEYEAALLTLATEAIALSVDARTRWHEVVVREEETRLAAEDATHVAALLDHAQARFEAGEASLDDLASARTAVARAQQALTETSQGLADARLGLMGLLGRPAAAVDWTIGSADTLAEREIVGDLRDEAALIAQLPETRLDVRAALARARAAKSQLLLAMRSRLGKLELGAGWERTMENDEGAGFAAIVELPIFNDGSHRIAKAHAQWRAAEIAAESARQQAITQIRQALAKAHGAQTLHRIATDATLAQTAGSLSRVRARHETGEAATRDVVDAQHAYTLAAIEVSALERSRRQARIALIKSTGMLSVEVPQ
jgi:outer membrane protein TolC